MEDDEDYYSTNESQFEEEEEEEEDDDDDDDDDDDELFDQERRLTGNSKSHSLLAITKESLLAAQMGHLRTVMDMLSVREHDARTLLMHNRWDVEKLVWDYLDKGKALIFAEAGVTVVERMDVNKHKSISMEMCGICMDAVPKKDTTSMPCGHCFCNNCWTEHFMVKINNGQSKRVTCMAHKCNAICDEDIVRNLVSLRCPDLAEKFDRFLLESYIEDNKMVKWCPSVPHCGNAIQVRNDVVCEVECPCGLQFCFSCSSQAHSPCPCLMWEMWGKKCMDESETANWISKHTKPCPKCGKNVEKNGGCNLIICTCKQGFCWLCGGATGYAHTWDTIASHSCGLYAKENKKKVESAKKDLDRYMHYFKRYNAHAKSCKRESLLREKIKVKIFHWEAQGWDLRDFSWLTDGLNRLLRSRHALACSYPFAFYMFGGYLFGNEMTEKERQIKQNLFEDQQQQLEGNIERLSKCLEAPMDEYLEDKVKKIRIKLMDLSVVTDRCCRKLYECIENDLLGSLKFSMHVIAPYRSQGIEKAVALTSGSIA